MIDILLIILLMGIAAAVVFYLHRQKKRGITCVGCPYAKQCAKKNGVKQNRKQPCGCSSTNTQK